MKDANLVVHVSCTDRISAALVKVADAACFAAFYLERLAGVTSQWPDYFILLSRHAKTGYVARRGGLRLVKR